MTIAKEDLRDRLSQLAPDELVGVISDALAGTPAAPRRHALAVMLRLALEGEAAITELAGPPRRVLDADDLSTDIRIQSEARRVVLATDLLDSSGVGTALGRTGTNLREAASTLRRSGALIGLPRGNTYVYPAFQFDLPDRRVWPVVMKLNKTLDAARDPWGVASWWLTPHPRLDQHAPRELIDTSEEGDLVALVAAELDPW